MFIEHISKNKFTYNYYINRKIVIYKTNLNLREYDGFFKEYAFNNYKKYRMGEETFDPNLSDQCCQIRACWITNIYNKYDDPGKIPDNILLTFGQGALISKCSKYKTSYFNLISKWIDVEKAFLEEILGHSLSNRKFEIFLISLKSIFSQSINEEIREEHLNKCKSEIRDDVRNHLSNTIYFSQKHKKIPFIPIFTAGYLLVKLIELLNLKVVLFYRQFQIDENRCIYLNGSELIPIINNKLDFNSNLLQNDDENVIVVEAYSCNFVHTEKPWEIKFHSKLDFTKAMSEFGNSFDFKESVLCCESLHDLYHQQPKQVKTGQIVNYEFDDLSEKYLNIVDKYKRRGVITGYGVNNWNPNNCQILDNDVPFDIFHIYSQNIRNLKLSIKISYNFLNVKQPLI